MLPLPIATKTETKIRTAIATVAMTLLAVFFLQGERSAIAQTTADPHAIYERRCAGCHAPHARDLAKNSLELSQGKVVLKGSDQTLAAFLARHPRQPPAKADAEALVQQFAAMLQTGFLFQQKCVVCHDRAAILARRQLIDRDGVLKGRYSGRDIEAFLHNHGRLAPGEAEIIAAMLKRQLQAQ